MKTRIIKATRVVTLVSIIVFALGSILATAASAWHGYGSGTSKCVQPTGQYKLTWTVENPDEDWNSSRYVMVVDSDTRNAFTAGTTVELGKSVPSSDELVDGSTQGQVNEVVNVHWSDGYRNRDYKQITASVWLDGSCQVPKQVPTVVLATSGPNCDATSFLVTITAGEGNTSTHVELIASPATIIKDYPEFQPKQSESINVPIAAGQTVNLTLLQDSKAVGNASIAAPSKQECHPTTTTTNPPTTTTTQPPKPPTTVPPAPKPPVPPVPPMLPHTGSSAMSLGIIGAIIVLTGALALFILNKKGYVREQH